MPCLSESDYYAELQLGSNATAEEITASYRRLARIHHPDKNPDNLEAATAAFQKIQLAYEVLSDPEQRHRYDTRGDSVDSLPSPGHYQYQSPFGFQHGPPEGFGSGGRFGFGGFGGLGGGFGGFGGGFFGFPGGYFNHTYQSPFSRRESPEAYRQRLEKEAEKRRAEHLERYREERDKCDAAETARKQAKDAAKQAEKDSQDRARADRQTEERSKQEARWAALDASATPDEHRAACLHSEFCVKMPQGHKFRCGACRARRGTTAFICPYCYVLLCQLCVSNFGARRARAEKQQPDPDP